MAVRLLTSGAGSPHSARLGPDPPSGSSGVKRGLGVLGYPNTSTVGVPAVGRGSVAHVHGRGRVAIVESLQAERNSAGIVVESDALAKQDRRDVQINFVDQAELQNLTPHCRREHFEVLAASSPEPDPHRLRRVAVQERDPVSRCGVLR